MAISAEPTPPNVLHPDHLLLSKILAEVGTVSVRLGNPRLAEVIESLKAVKGLNLFIYPIPRMTLLGKGSRSHES